MMRGHVVLVDDETALASVLEPALKAAGWSVTIASDGKNAVSRVLPQNPDMVLLNLGPRDMDGKDVVRMIRASSTVPIIVISESHQETEKIAALDEGADDYVNKPFGIGELMACIRTAVRGNELTATSSSVFESGRLKMDFVHRAVMLTGEAIKLSPKEYLLLEALARNAGHIVTHKRLLAAGWGNATADLQYVRFYMGLLRQKLEAEPAQPNLIVTDPGIGYRLLLDAR